MAFNREKEMQLVFFSTFSEPTSVFGTRLEKKPEWTLLRQRGKVGFAMRGANAVTPKHAALACGLPVAEDNQDPTDLERAVNCRKKFR